MKLPAFESLDEKMEIATELHYKTTSHVPTVWAVTNFKSGFNAGVIGRDKQWQSKVSKLLEFMERLTNTDICSTQPDVVWLSNWRNQAKTQAKNVLAEFYGEES